MRKINLIITFLFICGNVNAQTNRFKQEVFTDKQIKVDSNLTYGTALNYFPAEMVPLKMDIYYPDISLDTLKKRPVIIIFHPGNFLPSAINAGSNGGAYYGSRRDSGMVEMCRRFARRGWVAIAATHRMGWMANSSSSDIQMTTFIKALYRATQDSRTLIRFIGKSIDSFNNLYQIDGTKIVIGGSASGAIVALHNNSLDNRNDFLSLKFKDSMGGAIIDTLSLGGFYAGDHQGYNSKPNLILSLGGAVTDTSIISPDDAPIVAFHGVKDPLIPYDRNKIFNPSVFLFYGSYNFMLTANIKGINAPVIAAGGKGSRAGLYPFAGAGFEPYGWYNKAPNFAPTNARPRALLYIDTIMNWFTPYAVCILNLNTNSPVNVKNIEKAGLKVYPNPASEYLNITTTSSTIQTIKLIDITGKICVDQAINDRKALISTTNLSKGIYTVLVQTESGIIFQKVAIE